ncbi:MAG: phosphonate C-P lyase system protein PhnH [Hyphomicrobiales bacterium]|nr:phosphonate C-P lyase system protein PhnH [Hyphomicrobiales bacterium]
MSAVAKGFANPVLDAQAVFRAALSAMAEPGRVFPCASLPDAPLHPVIAAVALALIDYETPYAFIGGDAEAFLSFHTGAPRVEPQAAAFVFAPANGFDAALWRRLPHGSPEYPDRSATVVLEAGRFGEGFAVELSGPGLCEPRRFAASALDAAFWAIAAENAGLYPLGVDFIFCSVGEIAALPRSTRLRELG